MEEELNLLPESLPQCVWKIDPHGKAIYANSLLKDYVGSKVAEDFNVFSEVVVHPEDVERSVSAFSEATKYLKPFEVERRLKKYDGTYTWFLTRGTPVLDSEGNIACW